MSERKTRRAGAPRKRAKGRRRFAPRVLKLLEDSWMLGVRAGTEAHRFTGIWFVLVGGRVFVRPWNDRAGGWHRAFLAEPRGVILIFGREILVRAHQARGERLFDAVDAAYSRKYNTKASSKWVRGFALARRRKTTTELVSR